MGIIQREYYGRHQIDTGKYAVENEYIFENGEDYIGPYHILPNGKTFTGFIPSINSKRIIKKNLEISKDVVYYNNIKKESLPTHKSPVSIRPIITDEDIEYGQIQRFFIQKRNNPENSIMEIDVDQYMLVGTNSNGISEVSWNAGFCKWYIGNLSDTIKSELNRVQIAELEKKFKGIKKYIANYLEFS